MSPSVLVCSPTVGLSGAGDRTKETFVDGWVHTGDEVMINESMEIFIVDRIKVSGDIFRR